MFLFCFQNLFLPHEFLVQEGRLINRNTYCFNSIKSRLSFGVNTLVHSYNLIDQSEMVEVLSL